jgi:hypothetical protein
MKTIALLATLALTTFASAASFDAEAFGASLNGWRKDDTARYSLGDGEYSTHKPAITATHNGGIFLTTRVDLLASGRDRSTCHISLTFSRAGVLEAAQIKGFIGNKSIDTGIVRRVEPAADAPSADPTADLIATLFSAFDTEVGKIRAEQEKDNTDLFSRLGSKRARSGDVSAGLRHNLNLLLTHVRR